MSKKAAVTLADLPSEELLEENLTGPLKLQRAKTMPKPCLVVQAETPATDPTVRPLRSVSFRDADQVLVFGQNDAPMACGPDWDPDKFKYDSYSMFAKTLANRVVCAD